MLEKYGLVTFSSADMAKVAGIVLGEKVFTLDALLNGAAAGPLAPGMSVFDLVCQWDQMSPTLDAVVAQAAKQDDLPGLGLEEITLHAPIEQVRQIFCTGANYRTHVVHITLDMGVGPAGLSREELQKWAEDMMDERLANGEPYVFTKPVSVIAGPNDPLVLPGNTSKPDWELELAVVIGKGGHNIPLDQAMDHVAGYSIVNDVSARDLIPRKDYPQLGTDWLRAKGQPGFLPFGPYLVPAQFVPDPYNLKMELSVSGRLMQDESTADMMFDIARQIEYISRYAKLLPGDIICTGSPAGNGTHYNRFLQDGDLMVGTIEGLGAQTIRCVAGGN